MTRARVERSGTTAAVTLTMAFFLGCASAPPIEEVPSAESYYRKAEELLAGSRILFVFRDVDYPGAIELFQEVIDNYPYSDYATLAELRIADIQFEREDYEEALSYYQDFVELHPGHERVPYAIFRNGLCSFHQMREPDQDPGPAADAIAQFEVLLERYPNAPDALEASEMLHRARDHQARHETEVGDFYYLRGDYYAALRRYRQALTTYPEHTERLWTMTRLANSLKRLQRYYQAEQLYLQILDGEPEDGIQDEVLDELEEIRTNGISSISALQRSCVTDPNPACTVDPPPIP